MKWTISGLWIYRRCYFPAVTHPFDSLTPQPHHSAATRRCPGWGRNRGACITELGYKYAEEARWEVECHLWHGLAFLLSLADLFLAHKINKYCQPFSISLVATVVFQLDVQVE
jgi:hypothetical protein